MYNGRKRDFAAASRVAEHRKREDEAPRLRDQAPHLETLRLTFYEPQASSASYARPIVVATAPAFFAVRCLEPACDGRYDLTAPIVQAIRQRLTSYTGEVTCTGICNDKLCERTLIYVCAATYRPE